MKFLKHLNYSERVAKWLPGPGAEGGVLPCKRGSGSSLWDDDGLLCLDCDNGYPSLRIYQNSLNCILTMSTFSFL